MTEIAVAALSMGLVLGAAIFGAALIVSVAIAQRSQR
jgi:hypothetical protein